LELKQKLELLVKKFQFSDKWTGGFEPEVKYRYYPHFLFPKFGAGASANLFFSEV